MKTASVDGPLLVSQSRAMELLDITDYRTLRKLIQDGKITAVRIGGRYKITMQSILLLAGYGSR